MIFSHETPDDDHHSYSINYYDPSSISIRFDLLHIYFISVVENFDSFCMFLISLAMIIVVLLVWVAN